MCHARLCLIGQNVKNCNACNARPPLRLVSAVAPGRCSFMAEGLSNVEVAMRTGYTVVQISRIRRRFAEQQLAGLQERARSGRPCQINARQIARVVALTLKRPPSGLTHWSAREMARRTGLSHVTVHRIWQAHKLKPHQVATFKFNTDPEAEEEIRDIIGLYLNPPHNAAVICFDEKTQIQALNSTQPLLSLRPGLPARQTHDYRRNDRCSRRWRSLAAKCSASAVRKRAPLSSASSKSSPVITEVNCTSFSITRRRTKHPQCRPGWTNIGAFTSISPRPVPHG